MTWTAPKTWSDAVLTAAELNEQLRDNMLETAPAKVSAAGDLIVATGPNALKALPLGSADQVLAVNSDGDDVEWRTSEFDLDTVTNHLASDNSSVSSSFASYAAVSLTAGKWLIIGNAYVEATATGAREVEARLQNTTAGTTLAEGGSGDETSAGAFGMQIGLSLAAIVDLAAPSTVQLQIRESGTVGFTVLAKSGKGTGIVAVRLEN